MSAWSKIAPLAGIQIILLLCLLFLFFFYLGVENRLHLYLEHLFIPKRPQFHLPSMVISGLISV